MAELEPELLICTDTGGENVFQVEVGSVKGTVVEACHQVPGGEVGGAGEEPREEEGGVVPLGQEVLLGHHEGRHLVIVVTWSGVRKKFNEYSHNDEASQKLHNFRPQSLVTGRFRTELIFMQNWKMLKSESVRIRKCQNWKVSESEQFLTLSNLSSFGHFPI